MSRRATTTIGFLLVFIGLQLHFIDSYTLTPRATQFWAERIATAEQLASAGYANAQNTLGQYNDPAYYNPNYNNPNYNTPFAQAGYSSPLANGTGGQFANGYNGGAPIVLRPRIIRTPDWVCWPVLFLGTVFCLMSVVRKSS